MIKAIIFDCFGVIYSRSFEYVRDIAPDEKKSELENIRIQHDRGYLNQSEFLEQIGEVIGWSPDRVGALLREKHVLNQDLLELIKQLKAQYKIGLLSNIGQGWIDELFSEELKQQLFDSVVESERVHMIKPEPEIYHYAASALGMLPEECCFIDDSPRNIEGAKRVGMETILFTSTSNMHKALHALGVEYARTSRG